MANKDAAFGLKPVRMMAEHHTLEDNPGTGLLVALLHQYFKAIKLHN